MALSWTEQLHPNVTINLLRVYFKLCFFRYVCFLALMKIHSPIKETWFSFGYSKSAQSNISCMVVQMHIKTLGKNTFDTKLLANLIFNVLHFLK